MKYKTYLYEPITGRDEKKFDNLTVITLRSTPENIKFYEKNNFKVFDEIYGRVFLILNFSR